MKQVYVAIALENYELVLDLEREFAAEGLTPSYSWATDYKNEVGGSRKYGRREQANRCLSGVNQADVVLFVPPGKRGAHVELGAALGFGKRVVFWDRPEFTDHISFYTSVWVWARTRAEVVDFTLKSVGIRHGYVR